MASFLNNWEVTAKASLASKYETLIAQLDDISKTTHGEIETLKAMKPVIVKVFKLPGAEKTPTGTVSYGPSLIHAVKYFDRILTRIANRLLKKSETTKDHRYSIISDNVAGCKLAHNLHMPIGRAIDVAINSVELSKDNKVIAALTPPKVKDNTYYWVIATHYLKDKPPFINMYGFLSLNKTKAFYKHESTLPQIGVEITFKQYSVEWATRYAKTHARIGMIKTEDEK